MPQPKPFLTPEYLFKLITHCLLGLVTWMAIEMYTEFKDIKKCVWKQSSRLKLIERILKIKED